MSKIQILNTIFGPKMDFWNSVYHQDECNRCHTIRKVKFLSKNSILTKPQHFHEFFSQIFFWQFFSWNQSCQQLKSTKPQRFHEFFTPKNSTIFLGNQSWIFGQKMKISNSVRCLFFKNTAVQTNFQFIASLMIFQRQWGFAFPFPFTNILCT